MNETKEQIYYVSGMHCASCELLIEKGLLEIKGVKSVEASTTKGQVTIEYSGNKPYPKYLNTLFKANGYVFSEQPLKAEKNGSNTNKGIFNSLIIAGIIILGFIFLNKLGLTALINVSSGSSLIAFLLFGVLAGLSTCAALVGGMVLSMSKQWQSSKPHLMFNFGRLLSYGLFGAVLGLIGSKLRLSLSFTSILVILVSVLMFFLALQMLGVKAFRRFQISLPKFITRRIANQSNLNDRYMPFILGALTFFLPCGSTITAQGLALLSGSPIQGGLIMLFFALGTLPILLMIGLSSVKLSSRPHLSNRFLKVAGIVVIFFVLFNVNNQLNLLGLPNFNDAFAKINSGTTSTNTILNDKDLPPIINGKQVITMSASSSGYTPNYFKVRVNVPVRWEITDRGTSGCTNAVISKNLFDGPINLTPGQTSIKEFTPTKAGKYKFSCWMGMITGIIEVVDAQGSSANTNTANAAEVPIAPSGAQGCGCGGGAANTCSASN